MKSLNRALSLAVLAFVLIVRPASASQVVFSEVMYNPLPNKPEYIEVWNITNTPLDTALWKFTDGIQFTFPDFAASSAQAHFLKPNERILISSADAATTRAAYPGIPANVRIFGPWVGTTTLDNAGELIVLKDKNGVVMCRLNYKDEGKWPVAPDGTGHSLVLTDENREVDDWRVWRSSTNIGGSPGVADPALPGETFRLNELGFRAADGRVEWVEVRNNSAASVAADGLFIASALDFSNKVPLSGNVAAGGVISVNTNFATSNDGDVRLFLVDASNNVRDSVKIRRMLGRDFWQVFPAGSKEWYNDTAGTRDLQNNPSRNSDIVINELMVDPPSNEVDGEFIELYNRGASPVDVGGWQLDDAVNYTIPAGTTIQPGGYLVISANTAWFNANYSGVTAIGNWSGKLSNSGDRVRLEDANGNLVNQVDYRVGGEWPELAGGNGSSLELVNPNADNSVGSAWMDSNEGSKSTFQTFTINGGVYSDLTVGNVNDDEVRVWLVGDGHIIMKNIVLRQTGGSGSNLFVNGEVTTLNNNNVDGWQSRGSHWASYHDAEGVHIVADGSGDNKVNHAEKNATGMTSGLAYTMTFEARWVYGKPRVVAQSWDMSWGGTALVPIPSNLGTPGAQNSRYQPALPPQISSLRHSPAVPNPSSTVTVTARVSSNTPLTSVQLFHRQDNITYNGTWNTAAMVDDGTSGDALAGDGVYTAQVPLSAFGYNVSGRIVEFYVKANAANGESAALPRGSIVPESLASSQPRTGLWVVDAQSPPTDLRRVRVVISSYWLDALFNPTPPATTPPGQGTPTSGGGSQKFNYKFPRYSNHSFPCAFVHNDSEVYYGAGVHKTGSPFTRQGDNALSRGRLSLPGDKLFRGKRNMYWDNDSGAAMLHNRLHRYYLYLFGVPGNENEICRVTRNNDVYTVRETSEPFDKDMLDRIWDDGSSGRFFEIDDKFWIGDDGDTRLGNSNGSWDYGPQNSPGPENPVSYHNNFIPKSREVEYDFGPFTEWCRQLEIAPGTISEATISRMADINAMAAYAAIRGYSADWDNITMSRGKNGFFYNRSTDHKWMLIHWDSDLSLQTTHIDDPVVGTLTNVNTFYNRPFVRRALNYYLSELLGTYALNGTRMGAWISAEESASPSYTVPSAYASWPTTTSTTGQTRVQVIQAFIGSSLNAAFATTSPANGTEVTSELLTVTGNAPARAFKVICVDHPEAVLTFTGTSPSITAPWSLAGIQLKSGVNTLVFRMLDMAGAPVGTDITLTVNKTNGALPVLLVGSDPVSQNVGLGEVLTIDAGASYDPDGTPLSYGFSVTPANGFVMSSPSVSSRRIVFNVPGTYTVSIQATDGAGQTSTTSRLYSVHSAADFDNFNKGFQNVFTAENTELRDNYSPDSWYSFGEQTGNLVLQITDTKGIPARAGIPLFPSLTRAVPASSDVAIQTQLTLEGRQYGNFITGLYLVTTEGGLTTRYIFGIDNGTLLRAWRSTDGGSYTQVSSLSFNSSEATIRILRTGAVLSFQVRVNGTWTEVATQPVAPDTTLTKAGIFGATGTVNGIPSSPGQSLRVAFDYLLVTDPAKASPLLGSLRITEVMYNPSGASGVEYVELRNTGSSPIELAGTYFEAGSPFNDQFTFGQRTLQPGQFCVVTNSAAGFITKYGNTITIAGEYTGSLSNDGERVLLKDPQGNTIHDFVYDDVAPWPMAADGNGPSMEVNSTNPTLYSFGTNWRASQELNGSPGYIGLAVDADGDGYPDEFEKAFGSDPENAASTPLLPAPERDPATGKITIKWPSQIGRVYTVEYRDNFVTSVWQSLGNVTATETLSKYEDTPPVGTLQRIYRIRTQFPQ